MEYNFSAIEQKWQQYWKDQVANWYGMFLHESQYLEPVMRDIEAMLTSSQRHVNGTAILELRPLGFSTVGVDSKDDLVKNKFGEYGEMQKGWTAEDAVGSTNLFHFLDGLDGVIISYIVNGFQLAFLKSKAQLL